MKKLQDQVAIITGGAKGIGKGICELFAQQGATVVIWDIIDDGKTTARSINAEGGHCFFQKIDITDREAVKKAAEVVYKEYDRIDILINNAGIIKDRSLLKMTDEEWDDVFNVNLTGTFNTTKVVLPHMREAGYGRIISASSINGVLGAFGQTNYAAAKAGIIGFTKALAKEVGRYGVTANVVAPGFIKTDMTDTMPEAVIKSALAITPVGRVGAVEEVAHAYLFLASKEAGFVNGHVLHVNGGIF